MTSEEIRWIHVVQADDGPVMRIDPLPPGSVVLTPDEAQAIREAVETGDRLIGDRHFQRNLVAKFAAALAILDGKE